MKSTISERDFYKCLNTFSIWPYPEKWPENFQKINYFYFLDKEDRIIEGFPKGSTLRIKEIEEGNEDKKILQLKIKEGESVVLYEDSISDRVFDFIMEKKCIPQGNVYYSLIKNKIKIDHLKNIGFLIKNKFSTPVSDHFINSDFKNFKFHLEKVFYQDGASDFHISLSGEDALLKEKYFHSFLKHMKIEFALAEPVVEKFYQKKGIVRN